MAARAAAAGDPRLLIAVPGGRAGEFLRGGGHQAAAGTRATRASIRARARALEVVQDRVKMAGAEKARVVEAIEAALRVGSGRVHVFVEADPSSRPSPQGETENLCWKFSTDLHCADCDIHYSRSHAGDVLVQLAHRRVRDVPRLRARDRRRLRPGDSRRVARRSRGARSRHPDAELRRMPGRPAAKYAKKRGMPMRHRRGASCTAERATG